MNWKAYTEAWVLSHSDMVVENELYHHGIKGQKWGVRNGPPYPLQNGGKKKKSSGDKTEYSGHRAKKVKAAVRTAIGYVPIAGQVATAVDLGRSGIKRALAKGRLKKDDKIREGNENIDPKTGLRLKDKEYSDEEDMKRINPGYASDVYFSDKKTTNNCVFCTTAYELRKRGFDVRAKKTETGHGLTQDEINSLWKYKEKNSFNVRNAEGLNAKNKATKQEREAAYNKITDWIKKQPDQRGNIGVSWGFSGHSMVYEIKGGKLIIKDCQNNKTYKNGEKELKNLFSVGSGLLETSGGVSSVQFRRTDNATPNWENIKKLVE